MSYRSIARSLIRRLPPALLYEVFYQSARALGIRSYEVTGGVGNFFGPLYDQSVTKTYLQTGTWSQNILDILGSFFSVDGGTMYDIGANIGLLSIPLARQNGVTVTAFEPDPHNCSLLRANIAAADVAVRVVHAAVARERGELLFKRSDYNSGDHRISVDGTVSVKSVPLDDYPPPPGRFAVKIDTQGAEPLIFEGGSKVLALAGLIITEFWPWGMRRMNLRPDPILAFAQQNFDRGAVIRHGQQVTELAPIAEVMAVLEGVARAGGEFDQADLVLRRSL